MKKSEIHKQLEIRLLDAHLSSQYITLTFSILVSSIISYVIYQITSSFLIAVWFITNISISFLRFYLAKFHRNQNLSIHKIKFYPYSVSLLAGLSWAALSLFYNDTTPTSLQLLLLMVLGGLPIGSLSAYSHLLPSFVLFSLPIVFVLNYWAIYHTPEFITSFSLMMILFTLLIYITAYRFHQKIRATFLANIENEALVEKLQKRQEQLETLAYVDPLTELSNRRYFTVSSELALGTIHRKNAKLYFLLIDADQFKHINDQYGHEAGDHVLKHIADCLQETSEKFNRNALFEYGQTSEAARLGGDEFIMSFVVLDKDLHIEPLANQLLEKIHQSIEFNNKIIHPKVSIGISEAPRQAEELSTLLRLADKAMYQAKKHGGDQVFHCHSTDFEKDAPKSSE